MRARVPLFRSWTDAVPSCSSRPASDPSNPTPLQPTGHKYSIRAVSSCKHISGCEAQTCKWYFVRGCCTDHANPGFLLPAANTFLNQQLPDDPGFLDAGEAEVEALGAHEELFVIKAELVKDGGVDVVHVGGILHGPEAEFIGRPIS